MSGVLWLSAALLSRSTHNFEFSRHAVIFSFHCSAVQPEPTSGASTPLRKTVGVTCTPRTR
eukprot:2204859-Rhodomonas_salina.4